MKSSLYKAGVAAASLIISIAALSSPALAGKADNTVRFAYDQAPESLDPYFNNVRIGVIIGQHVWDTLVYRDPDTGEYKGQLAESWKQIDDKTIEFKLREGIKFHNGEEFDADDVVFTLNFVSKADNGVITQQNVSWIDHAEKVDKYTVRLMTKEVFPAGIEYLSGPVVMHPNEYYAEVGPKGMNEKPVGTGPFKVTSYDMGKSVTLEKNPDYFADSPKKQGVIEKVDIRFIPDRQTQAAEVLSEGVDFIMHVPKDQAEQMEAVPHLKVTSGETMRIAFMQMNSRETTPNKELQDIRVRKAISHAIDRKTMTEQIVGKGARVLNTFCFPSQFGCTDEGAVVYEYDPDKSKALLAEAGFANGLNLEIVAYRERDQTEAMINYLKAVGINVNLHFLQYAAMRELVRGDKVGLTHQTWGSFSVNDVSASTPVYMAFEGDDIVRDPEVRDLLKKGDTTIDPEERKAVYKQALTMIADKALVLPLYSLPVYYVTTADLEFKAYPDEMPRFWEMSWN